MSCKTVDIDFKDVPCGEQIKSIYIVNSKDVVIDENGEARIKRKYGKFKREIQRYR
jgi:hypothetical protein